jgi:WD40 repeat protein
VASSYATGIIIIWDWEAGKPWQILDGHSDIVENIAYSPDGSLLASASDDSSVILWDLAPELASEERIKATFIGHRALVYDVAFSIDGKFLVSGGGDGLVKVWDLETARLDDDTPMVNLYGNTNRIHAVAFSPDKRHVVSGSTDHSVRVYTMDVPELVSLAEDRMTRVLTSNECGEYLHMTCESFEQSDPLKPITDFFNRIFRW